MIEGQRGFKILNQIQEDLGPLGQEGRILSYLNLNLTLVIVFLEIGLSCNGVIN